MFWLVWRLFDYFLVFRVKLTLPSHSHLITATSPLFSIRTRNTPYNYDNITTMPKKSKKTNNTAATKAAAAPLRLQLTQGQAPTKLRGRSSAPQPLTPIPVFSSVLFYTSSTVIRMSLRMNIFQNLMLPTHMIRGHNRRR